MKYLLTICLILLAVTISLDVNAQELEARSQISDDLPSSAININYKKDFNHEKTANFPKTKTYIIIKKPEKVLYGNPCMEEITREMGFQYLLIPKTSAEGYTNESPFWHNIKVHFKLIGKNGPFYKRKIRRAIKFCRQMSGDFVA